MQWKCFRFVFALAIHIYIAKTQVHCEKAPRVLQEVPVRSRSCSEAPGALAPEGPQEVSRRLPGGSRSPRRLQEAPAVSQEAPGGPQQPQRDSGRPWYPRTQTRHVCISILVFLVFLKLVKTKKNRSRIFMFLFKRKPHSNIKIFWVSPT